MSLTCSKDLRPLSLPSFTRSSRMAFFTSWQDKWNIQHLHYDFTLYSSIVFTLFYIMQIKNRSKWLYGSLINTLFLHNSSNDPSNPLFLAQPGRKSGSGTRMATRHAWRGRERGDRWEYIITEGYNEKNHRCEWVTSSHLQAVSMYEGLHYSFTPDVNILNLLWGDVFSLSQLKNVLLTVHNLQSAVLWRWNISREEMRECRARELRLIAMISSIFKKKMHVWLFWCNYNYTALHFNEG